MTNQPKKSTAKLSVMLVMGLVLHAEAMQYNQPLEIKELKDLFGEDGCIEGTLSTIQMGEASPFNNWISFTDQDSLILGSKQNVTEVLDEKSPMSSVNELADFNRIKVQYTLIKEEGPSHKKRFGVSLELGNEHYYGEGNNIKHAQHEAAKFALNSTTYEHPPIKPKTNKVPKYKTSPVEKLDSWAIKHNHATIKYSFIQQSKIEKFSNHVNIYHENMYSKAQNVHKVSVKVGNEQFEGEGPSLDIAKQLAARNALEKLQNAEGFCMFDSETQNLFTKIFNPGSESEISLVFEFASKSKMKASFELVSEEGPAHIKRFVYKCIVGDKFETFGEGSNKKAAKKEAAENMLHELKTHFHDHPVNCGPVLKTKKKSKKNRSKNLIKSVIKSEFEEEENLDYFVPDNIDPISKLIQIQQSKHDVPPIFTYLQDKEKSQLNNNFFIEVIVGDQSFVGSGPNKKAAKRNAAEGMLEKLGYSTVTGKTRFHSSEQKKKIFIEDHTTVEKKQLGPGINLNSNKFVKLDDDAPHMKSVKRKEAKSKDSKLESKGIKAKSQDTKSKPKDKDKFAQQNKIKKTSHSKPKAQLESMAQQLGLRFQFSDFPKADKSGFVSLLSMTTDPPTVCYGLGETTDQSQDLAALTALENLYKSEMHIISQILRKQNAGTKSEEDTNLMDETATVVGVIKASFGGKTE